MVNFDITWYGHANILIQQENLSILIDPFFEGNKNAPDWHTIPPIDIIAITHDHGDHLGQTLELVQAMHPKIVCIADLAQELRSQGVPAELIVNYGSGGNIGGTVSAFGTNFTFVPATHSCKHGVPVGYVLHLPHGGTIYHAGDTGLYSDMALLSSLSVDVACLPMGGVFTMDEEACVRAAELINPKYVLPIHFATFPALAQDTAKFEQLLNASLTPAKMLKAAPQETKHIVI